MYHCRFKKTHYEAGLKFGSTLSKRKVSICEQKTFFVNEEKREFVKGCLPIYEKFYPEILEEIKGIADGQNCSYEDLLTFLISMYCFEFSNHCTCFAFKDEKNIFLGRNSDFVVDIEKLCMNCIYDLENVYSFTGNTTAFIQMEDGINEHGLAAGITFIYPKVIGYGLNAGMLVRYILEKCKSAVEAVEFLKRVPIASQQTITLADKSGDIKIVECNSQKVEIIDNESDYLVATNFFSIESMNNYNNFNIDDWNAEERYRVVKQALLNNKNDYSLILAKNILSGKYGFTCQYNRKERKDTIWSVIYDLNKEKIYRVEGNPSRKVFKEDIRFKFCNEK